MNSEAATQLKAGDRVMWDGDPKDLGTVMQVGHRAAQISWDVGLIGWIAFEDATRIEKAQVTP